MTLKEKVKTIRDFYGYSTSYYDNMMDAIEKAERLEGYTITNVTVNRNSPFVLWEIEKLLGEYYFNTEKPFDFNLIK